MILDERFRNGVDRELKRLGWSRSDLAREMDRPPSFVSQYLNGDRSPGFGVVELFAKALRMKDPAKLLATEKNLQEVA